MILRIIIAILLFAGTVWGGATLDPAETTTIDPAQTTSLAPLSKGLVAHWALKTPSLMSATVVADEVGSNHGTIAGNPIVGAASTAFDGTGDYVSCGETIGDYTDTFTISAWIQTSTVGRTIISRREGTTQWHLELSGAGALSLYDGVASRSGIGSLADGDWHHIATVINGASSRHYVNGVTNGSAFTPSITSRAVTTALGAWNDGGNDRWVGGLHDIRIYNEAKDQAFITALYNSGE